MKCQISWKVKRANVLDFGFPGSSELLESEI